MSRPQKTQRDKKTPGFTQIDNSAILNGTMSLKSKGLLVVMLSRPPDWIYHMTWLTKQSKDGKEAHQSALKELETLGYVVRTKSRGEQGHITWDYVVSDKVQGIFGSTTTGKPGHGEASTTKGSAVNGDTADGDAIDGQPAATNTDPTNTDPTKTDPTKTLNPSAADASGGSVPEKVFEVAQPPKPPTSTEESAKRDGQGSSLIPPKAFKKVPAGGAATELQAMEDAIRAALYPGQTKIADSLERQITKVSKDLRSAGLTQEAPAGILAMIKTKQSWRMHINPRALVEHSAEWVGAQQLDSTSPLARLSTPTARPVGRANTTREAVERSFDTATSVLDHIRSRRGSQ